MATPTSRVVIVTISLPDSGGLNNLCLKSTAIFAPGVDHRFHFHRGFHWQGIHAVRAQAVWDAYDVVILMDNDAVVLSPDWLGVLTERIGHGVDIRGGIKHSGRIQDLVYGDRLLVHMNCVAMTRRVFMQTNFSPRGRWDTGAALVMGKNLNIEYLGFWPIGEDPIYGGLEVGVYTDSAGRMLWSHLMHGTGMRLNYPRWTYRIRAGLGSQTAATLLRRDRQRQAWINISQRYLETHKNDQCAGTGSGFSHLRRQDGAPLLHYQPDSEVLFPSRWPTQTGLGSA